MVRPMSEFTDVLRAERKAKGWSQLALALEAEISPRHLSFLETGRAAPSRSMVARLAEVLDLPLRRRNALFEGAGYAPPYRARALDAPAMAAVEAALARMLEAQAPYPALAMSADWRLRRSNAPYKRMLELVGVAAAPGLDLLALILEPGPVRALIVDWETVAAQALRRCWRDAADAARRRDIAEMAQRHGAPADWRLSGPATETPVMPVTLRLGEAELSWISTVAGFGSAADITAAELMIEFFHPADARTEALAADLFG